MAQRVKSFIPAADEVFKLENGNDEAARYYRNIRKRHISHLPTTQGTYIVTPSGILIDSGHSFTKSELADFLTSGLKKYKSLSKKERLRKTIVGSTKLAGSRFRSSRRFAPGRVARSRFGPSTPRAAPIDGLVLRITLRKLYSPKPTGPRARGVIEWNQDFAWFRKNEAAQFLPANPKTGTTHDIPAALIMRLAKYHFIDTVRTFCDPYPDRCVKTAKLTSTVLDVRKNLVSIRLNGEVHSAQNDTPKWGIVREARIPRRPERSFDATLLGYATYDVSKQKFTKFELVAFGSQNGGGTHFIPGPVAMGVVLTLAGDSPVDRVEPRHVNLYSWK